MVLVVPTSGGPAGDGAWAYTGRGPPGVDHRLVEQTWRMWDPPALQNLPRAPCLVFTVRSLNKSEKSPVLTVSAEVWVKTRSLLGQREERQREPFSRIHLGSSLASRSGETT